MAPNMSVVKINKNKNSKHIFQPNNNDIKSELSLSTPLSGGDCARHPCIRHPMTGLIRVDGRDCTSCLGSSQFGTVAVRQDQTSCSSQERT